MKAIRILLVDPQKMVREALRDLLNRDRNMQVVGDTHDGETALSLAASPLAPNLVIIDLGLEGLNAVDVVRQFTSSFPEIRVIAISSSTSKALLGEAVRAGASGCLLKESGFHELIQAVETASSNRIYISPDVADIMVNSYVRRNNHGNEAFHVLTAREREVLSGIASGQSSKQIASDLNLCVKTVDAHRQEIMRRLDLHSVADLTKYAIRENLSRL